MNILKNNDKIIFQGDSITDCGRLESPDGLGAGYVSIINGLLGSLHPDLHLTFINKGVSGDRTEELLNRWKEDFEDIKPDVLSIKIGVNDVWRILEEWQGQKYIGPKEFQNNYQEILDRTLKAKCVREIILCSPTIMKNNKDPRLSDLLKERCDIVKNLAKEYKAIYVPLQEFQLSLLDKKPEVMWTTDGCHPTIAGHTSLAYCWLKTLNYIN